jgi:glyoxylase-like metal-dependent hydrolase (beta-lactamase superfamily II)
MGSCSIWAAKQCEKVMDPMEPSVGDSQPHIDALPVGMLAANCYLVLCPRTRRCLVLDPGAEPERILARLRELQAEVVSIVHTHGHFDHISATEAVLAGLPGPVPVLAHPADAYLYEAAARGMGAAFGYPLPEQPLRPNGEMHDGDVVTAGDVSLHVIATPGHTPGSVSLVERDLYVFAGDTLFRRGIGRTDLPGGDEEAIYESIARRLYPLPPAIIVYPGHGPATTIGEERRGNPFVQASDDASSGDASSGEEQ